MSNYYSTVDMYYNKTGINEEQINCMKRMTSLELSLKFLQFIIIESVIIIIL